MAGDRQLSHSLIMNKTIGYALNFKFWRDWGSAALCLLQLKECWSNVNDDCTILRQDALRNGCPFLPDFHGKESRKKSSSFFFKSNTYDSSIGNRKYRR